MPSRLLSCVLLVGLFASAASAANTLTRAEFADTFLGPDERTRIAALMCQKGAYLASCIGPVSKAANPANNGSRLSAGQCQAFFKVQIRAALGTDQTKSAYFLKLPEQMSLSQAQVARQALTRDLQAIIVEAMIQQGADVDKSPGCANRLMRTISLLDKTSPAPLTSGPSNIDLK